MMAQIKKLRRYSSTLIIKLGANEIFRIKTTSGRTIFTCTMAGDELTVDCITIPYTEHSLGTDLGNTGWTP